MRKIKENSKIVECPICNATLEYDDADIFHGEYGAPFVRCPDCDDLIEVDGEHIVVTPKNIVYPDHFFDFSHGVSIGDKRINEIVRSMLESAKDAEIGSYSFWASGNLLVICLTTDEGCRVVVTEDYKTITLDLED